ncbi:Cupredoxin [Phyllosticta citriasiana]|uniref:Cupredoxin n=1 Tax=Phyllosticta citriasiana TaxID=595635 RepID=UPI0030FD6948
MHSVTLLSLLSAFQLSNAAPAVPHSRFNARDSTPLISTLSTLSRRDGYYSPALLSDGTSSLEPALDPSKNNGASKWGTLDAPTYGKYLPAEGAQRRDTQSNLPWGSRTANGSNPYTDMPDTGVTRYYEFTVSYLNISPDGVDKAGLVINGQYPGPLIEANWGDWIEVKVNNALPDEGTAIHWHGLLQKETGWEDGVPAVTQCPIAPNDTYVYRFQADLYGTSFYHSHYSSGAFGPLIIHGPNSVDYDIDIGPVLINDWYHSDYYDLVENVMAGGAPKSNNNLIQGRMNYPCANTTSKCTPNAGISKFTFQSGKRHRLRLINGSGEGLQKFSIDGHKLEIIAEDFVPVVPYTVDYISLGPGQRSDVIVEATAQPGSAVWLRSVLTNDCSLTDGVSPVAVAAIYYDGADTNAIPNTNSTITEDQLKYCGNDALDKSEPLYSITPNPEPEVTLDVDIKLQWNGTNHVWTLNNHTFHGDYNAPILPAAVAGQTTFAPELNVFNLNTKSSESEVRVTIYNHASFTSHPMHLHGSDSTILSIGAGVPDYASLYASNSTTTSNSSSSGFITSSNHTNPPRRDVIVLPPAPSNDVPSHLVVQFKTDNPGTWAWHCHTAAHVSNGLYMTVIQRQDELKARSNGQVPQATQDLCKRWGDWCALGEGNGNNGTVGQIDSGL